MSDIEINEGNCVLSDMELGDIRAMINTWYYNQKGYHNSIETKLLFQKINKLNEMAKELHSRNLSVKTIVKFHDIGKQAEEKQK